MQKKIPFRYLNRLSVFADEASLDRLAHEVTNLRWDVPSALASLITDQDPRRIERPQPDVLIVAMHTDDPIEGRIATYAASTNFPCIGAFSIDVTREHRDRMAIFAEGDLARPWSDADRPLD